MMGEKKESGETEEEEEEEEEEDGRRSTLMCTWLKCTIMYCLCTTMPGMAQAACGVDDAQT